MQLNFGFYKTIFLLGVFCYTIFFMAQQDAQFSQYMYQTQVFNPAYAGTRGLLSMTGLHRTQWVGFSGAPTTYAIGGHSPISNGIMGVGLMFTHDEIGPTRNSNISGQYAYNIDLNERYKLSFGVSIQARIFGINRQLLNPEDITDFTLNDLTNSTVFNFGSGVYLFSDKFYAGVSVPNFLQTQSWQADQNAYALYNERMHFYVMSGYVFDLSESVKFKPAFLAKFLSGAPFQLDASANFLFYDRFTLGAAYRYDAALSGLMAIQLTDQIMLGYAYDRETTNWGRFNDGSHEFFLRFELKSKHNRTISPRFF
jgi:type IX secretion system PorP/SprF family membrane protein